MGRSPWRVCGPAALLLLVLLSVLGVADAKTAEGMLHLNSDITEQ